ncbi:hypothetical protein NPS01_12440 [Nocardioides psychrotolerans]|uniref:Energy-coupling factor transport system substrate-specific component n=1 Tax=Nocardioides psychrotolerans TaxID=1005945 RepID=A0A1I3DZ07_9ACTN|nr:ECF transporter S component [Nocardioides psychrotolerans]GEP37581.1 hypothetical protein NPS01_12440 [Nocardioides psychrotolerans]SFH91946.1 energy-coupling factor transport system substrate-specific component [Nocardioides psychrotolerans]
MEVPGTPPESRTMPRWDPLALELQALRTSAGDPSFAEIARRVSEQRLARDVSPHAARVARTTVYDAFRTGRARVNLELVRDISTALGASDADVDAWVTRCRDVQQPEPHQATAPAPPPVPPTSVRESVLLMAACLGINLLGRLFVDFLDLPIHLDMVGTAIAAIALGPWRGAAVGASTNVVGALLSGAASLPFALVNVAGALAWGYGVRRFGLGRTLPRFLALNVMVAGISTLLAVPILVGLYGGSAGNGQDAITATFMALTDQLIVSVGFSNLLVSLADKLFSGFVALVVISTLPAGLRLGSQLVLSAPPPPR